MPFMLGTPIQRWIEDVTPSLQLAAITADGAPGCGAPSAVERSVSDLLGVVRELLDLDVAFVGVFCQEERRFRRLPASAGATLSAIRAAQRFGLALGGSPGGATICAPVQFEEGSKYGLLCGSSQRPDQALGPQAVKGLEIAAQATARLFAQADGHDIALGSAMAVRSPLINRM